MGRRRAEDRTGCPLLEPLEPRILLAAGAPAAGLAAAAYAATLGSYHNYSALTAELTGFAAAYPDIARLYSIGKSVQGRDLWALEITDNPTVEENEPEFKYVGAMHGNEPVGTEMCLYFIDYLLENYGSSTRVTNLVNDTDIWIVPLMNPDGREAATRENASGYDLNRSFPEGSPPNNLGNILDGPAMNTAGLQPEVADMMQWSAEHSFTLSANFHTGSLVVNYPYDSNGLGSTNSPTPDDALFENIAQVYSSHNSPMWNSPDFYHGITNGAAWYAVSGGMQDWNYRYLADNEVTIELSNSYWPSASKLPTLWSQNQESMLSFAEAANMGVRGIITDSLGHPVFGQVAVQGNTHPVFTDPDVGDYHRMLLPGTYNLTFSAPGYNPETASNVVVSAAGPTVVDIVLESTVPLPPTPEVAVSGGGLPIAAGDATPRAADGTDFGSVAAGQTGPSRTFLVRNAGTAPLETGGLTVPAGYTITEPLSATIAAGASDTFTVQLTAAAVGVYAGDIQFATNDADAGENPFHFAVRGTVGDMRPFGPRNPLKYVDSHASAVTIKFKGAGSGEVWFPSPDPGDPLRLVLTATDPNSVLSITVKGRRVRTQVGDLGVTGSLKKIAAPAVDLAGALTVTGGQVRILPPGW